MQTQQQLVKKTERFIEIDALKFIALLFILYAHSDAYTLEIPFLQWFQTGGVYTGLGLFILMSGYGLQHSATSGIRQGKFNKLQFFKKRLLRIYPLYLVALVSYVIVFHYLNIYHSGWIFSEEILVIHFFSLQVVLYPYFSEIPTLWFIGLLMPLYLLFTLTAKNKTLKFIVTHIAVFATLLFCSFLFKNIDNRFFLYYPIFVLGCLFSRSQVFPLKKSKYSVHLSWLLGFLTLGIYFLFKYFDFPEVDSNRLTSFKQIASYGLILSYIVISIIFLISLISQYTWFLDRFKQYITPISELLYPAYLFHRIVYAVSYYFLLDVLNLSKTTGTFLFPIVTLLLLAIALLISRFEISLINRFQTIPLRFASRKR